MNRLPDVSTGFHIFLDGNAWCAVGPDFIDLQASDAGFGNTQRAAYRAWLSANKARYSESTAPAFEEFKIHHVR